MAISRPLYFPLAIYTQTDIIYQGGYKNNTYETNMLFRRFVSPFTGVWN